MLMHIVRYSALMMITIVVVWALVLGWWQSNEHAPSQGESLLYLIALPLALFGGFVMLNAFFKSLRTSVVVHSDAQRPATSTVDESALAREAEFRTRTLSILDLGILAPGASDAAGFLALVREGKTPQPDTRLRDEDGFPAFVARIDEIDAHAKAEHVADFADLSRWPAAFDRNVAILDQLMTNFLPAASARIDAGREGESFLRVVCLTDGQLTAVQADELCAWLKTHHFAHLGDDRFDISIAASENPISGFSQIDQLCELAPNELDRSFTLLLASASNVDEHVLHRWQAQGRLFLPDQQKGQVPGELGVALLLGTPATATACGATRAVRLSRPNARKRDKSADTGGRISASICESLCTELLTLFKTSPAHIRAVVTDSDHRASRQSEALEVIDETFETIDPAHDFLALGTASGSAAPASALLCIACAAELVAESDAPALVLSVQDPTRRAALLLMPSLPTVTQNNTE